MTRPLSGVFAPVTTPFGPDGAADPERLAAQIEIYAATDLAGFVLFGTSGEGPMLEPDEEAPLLAAARRATPLDRRLIVQVGRESVRASRAAARRAVDAGADAVLCLPLRYYAIDDDVVAEFYRAVAEPLDVPLLAYHIPQRSKVDLPGPLILELAAEGVVRGIKDSAGDLALQARLRRDAGPDFSLLDGKASVMAESLDLGADGAILAVADAAPEIACGIFAAHRAGDRARARSLQARLGPLAECLGPRFGVAGIKAALDLRGWPGGGPTRAPLRTLGDEGRQAVAEALAEAGVEIGAPRGA
ncbi:MAG TPA: dihydrodipicolinate synthase family protein [Gemmatimonadota bacterium]|jgi:dihydrodipicolinate synthase/N-acetylneuraminate lyase|nr:dihydrodipicolinate synthase family protein [Gemmatimonadota bacterium]